MNTTETTEEMWEHGNYRVKRNTMGKYIPMLIYSRGWFFLGRVNGYDTMAEAKRICRLHEKEQKRKASDD